MTQDLRQPAAKHPKYQARVVQLDEDPEWVPNRGDPHRYKELRGLYLQRFPMQMRLLVRLSKQETRK